jgi:predicted HicB family RNase H-like nuclease
MAKELNDKRVVILLPPRLREQVKRRAKKEDVSVCAIARQALRKYVETNKES